MFTKQRPDQSKDFPCFYLNYDFLARFFYGAAYAFEPKKSTAIHYKRKHGRRQRREKSSTSSDSDADVEPVLIVVYTGYGL